MLAKHRLLSGETNTVSTNRVAGETIKGASQMQKQEQKSAARRRMFIWLVLWFAVGAQMGHNGAAETLSESFRIGFASSMFSDVNENDAKAAVKVWGQLLAREWGVPTDPDPAIFKDVDAILRSLREKQVDALGITVTEYERLRRDGPQGDRRRRGNNAAGGLPSRQEMPGGPGLPVQPTAADTPGRGLPAGGLATGEAVGECWFSRPSIENK